MFNVFLFALLLVGFIACGSIESVPYRTTWPVNSDDQTTWPVSSDDELIRLKTISNGSQAIINNVEQAKATVTPESIFSNSEFTFETTVLSEDIDLKDVTVQIITPDDI